jgi:hypothetical protein
MSESLPTQTQATVDPSLLAGSTLATPEIQVRFNTFEEAQTAEKRFSDSFIEGAIDDKLKVGSETVGIKGYLDKVEATPSDNETIANPDAIAALYLKTTDMLARNLKIMTVRNADPTKDAARKSVIKSAKEDFLAKLHDEAGTTADGIVDWSTGKSRYFPVKAMEYHGLEIDGKDPLNAESKHADDFRPNFKIQRQMGGAFIMAYSDNRVREKVQKQDQELGKRIYLNPEAFATPDVFEQVLTTANQAGLSIQLKMYQRAPEFAEAHFKRERGDTKDGFRGDGIVIYADEAQANDVLAMVLSIAKDKPEAFVGRKTSKIPQNVAEGIAVGDEPTQMKGTSLTSHRVKVLEYAASYVRQSGKTGEEAKDLYRRCLAATAKANKVNPRNIAFNAAV